MVINLQKTVDMQGKKIIDLEDYIDNLLIKILDVAPILLKQESPLISKHAYGWILLIYLCNLYLHAFIIEMM